MDIGITRETFIEDRRVLLVPAAVDLLVRQGHTVHVEHGAGDGAGFSDEAYAAVGANLVFTREEALRRPALLCKIMPPTREEAAALAPGQQVMSFLQVGVQGKDALAATRAAGVTAFALELIEDDGGGRPVLTSMSEITGSRMPIIAGRFLEVARGGRGIAFGGVPGVPPAMVVIVGAGTVGRTAARAFSALGANVVLLDQRVANLREVGLDSVTRLLATPYTIARTAPSADVLVGCVFVPGERAPHVVPRDIVRAMRPRSLVVDVSIDQGGCIETSRPTTLSEPTYEAEGIIHCCVPNIPSSVARSASYALSAVILPYVRAIADGRVDPSNSDDRALLRGRWLDEGRPSHASVTRTLGWEASA